MDELCVGIEAGMGPSLPPCIVPAEYPLSHQELESALTPFLNG